MIQCTICKEFFPKLPEDNICDDCGETVCDECIVEIKVGDHFKQVCLFCLENKEDEE